MPYSSDYEKPKPLITNGPSSHLLSFILTKVKIHARYIASKLEFRRKVGPCIYLLVVIPSTPFFFYGKPKGI